jgi:hypothetical protein
MRRFHGKFHVCEMFGEIRIALRGVRDGFRVAVDIPRGGGASATDGEDREDGFLFGFVEDWGAAGIGHDGVPWVRDCKLVISNCKMQIERGGVEPRMTRRGANGIAFLGMWIANW